MPPIWVQPTTPATIAPLQLFSPRGSAVRPGNLGLVLLLANASGHRAFGHRHLLWPGGVVRVWLRDGRTRHFVCASQKLPVRGLDWLRCTWELCSRGQACHHQGPCEQPQRVLSKPDSRHVMASERNLSWSRTGMTTHGVIGFQAEAGLIETPAEMLLLGTLQPAAGGCIASPSKLPVSPGQRVAYTYVCTKGKIMHVARRQPPDPIAPTMVPSQRTGNHAGIILAIAGPGSTFRDGRAAALPCTAVLRVLRAVGPGRHVSWRVVTTG